MREIPLLLDAASELPPSILGAPEHPVIANLMATGYPDGKEPIYPHCPICGKECETIYYTAAKGEIAGCDMCLTGKDAWEEPQCFPDERS